MLHFKVYESSSKGNFYSVSNGISALLLECGISWVNMVKHLKGDFRGIEGCLVTHEHKDHFNCYKDLLNNGFKVFASRGTWESSGVNAFPVEHLKKFDTGSFEVMPFNVEHDCAEPFGYIIKDKTTKESMLFCMDTRTINYTFTHKFSVIAIECNHSKKILAGNLRNNVVNLELAKRISDSHMSLENVKEFLERCDLSRCREIHLLHLSDLNSDEKLFKKEIEALTGIPVLVAKK